MSKKLETLFKIMNNQNISKIFNSVCIKKILNLAEFSSCHGIPNITRTNSIIIRLVWTIAFIISFVYSILSVVQMGIEYLNFDIVVNMELIQDFNIDFPAVTICNNNPIDFTHKNSIKSIEDYFYSITNTKANFFSFKNGNESLTCNQDYRKLARSSFKNFGFSLDKMLINCVYDDKMCSRDDFSAANSTVSGKCYTFNSDKSQNRSSIPVRKLKRNGLQNGLKLQLFVGAPEYQPCWIHENGAVVVIHNQSVPPLYVEEGIKLPTGMESNLVLKKVKIKKLTFPYSGCVMNVLSEESFNSDSFRNTIKKFGIYTQKWCILTCAYELNAISNTNCSISPTMECLEELLSLSKYYSACAEECPIECDLQFYNFFTNYAKFPSSSYAKYLLSDERIVSKFPYSNPTAGQLGDSILSLNVYFDSNLYERITEEPKVTFNTLVSNFGGQLGLFLGISLLSFVEIIEIIIEIFFVFFNR